MATHSSILAWRFPQIEEPGGLQSLGSQRVRHEHARTQSLPLSVPCHGIYHPRCVPSPGERCTLVWTWQGPLCSFTTPASPASFLLVTSGETARASCKWLTGWEWKKLMQHCKERARTNGEGKGHGGGNMDFSSTSEQILDFNSQPWNCQRKCLDTVGCLSIREKEGFLHCQREGLSPL